MNKICFKVYSLPGNINFESKIKEDDLKAIYIIFNFYFAGNALFINEITRHIDEYYLHR